MYCTSTGATSSLNELWNAGRSSSHTLSLSVSVSAAKCSDVWLEQLRWQQSHSELESRKRVELLFACLEMSFIWCGRDRSICLKNSRWSRVEFIERKSVSFKQHQIRTQVCSGHGKYNRLIVLWSKMEGSHVVKCIFHPPSSCQVRSDLHCGLISCCPPPSPEYPWIIKLFLKWGSR